MADPAPEMRQSFEDRVLSMLQEAVLNLRILVKEKTAMASKLDDLVSQVHGITDTTKAVVALIDGINAKLTVALAEADPAKIQAAIDELSAAKDTLAAAVVANTPAAPAPAPVDPAAPTS